VVQYANSWKIKLVISTHYYAQDNGQVEAINKILISLIKNMLAKNLEVGMKV